jgi:fructokinase
LLVAIELEEDMDVVALGELLIDFTENGVSSQGNPLFEANPGGAPCNVLAMLSGLGHTTAFIGKVGNDFFGKQLEKAITEVGIDAKGLLKDNDVHTTLALVHTYPDGDRDFSFYRNPGADMMLTEEEVPVDIVKSARIFHFGTLSMTHERVRLATKKAIAIAQDAGAIISFDPNIREPLWNSLDDAREQVLYGLQQCDILKISDNEIQWLTGEDDFTEGVRWINMRYHIPLILVSMGKEGSRAYYQDKMVEAAPFIQKNTIETTGAGDTFCACVLHYVLEHGLQKLTDKDLKDMLTYANAAASIVTTRKGALRVMPQPKEIEELIKA